MNRTSHPTPLTSRPLWWLTTAAVIGCAFGLYLALVYAPTNPLQGGVQRIFYVHLAAFAGALVGFMSAVVGGLAYLRTRRVFWDMLALAGVEVGLLLASVNVLTGAVYARPIVNSWWTWDPKLTAVAIMVLTYAAYLMLRGGVENPDKRRLFAAVYGALAFVTVIYTFLVIRVRSDVLHEPLFAPGRGGFTLPGIDGVTLLANVLIWAGLVAPVLMAWRLRLERRQQAIERLRLRVLDGYTPDEMSTYSTKMTQVKQENTQ